MTNKLVTYTFTNGTTADANEVNQNFIDTTNKYYGDNSTTGFTQSAGITEVDISTFTINQNDLGVSGNLIIQGNCYYKKTSNNERDCVFRLYVNNIVVQTITLSAGISSSAQTRDSASFSYLATSLDTSLNSIEVKITGQLENGTESAQTASVFGLTGIGGRV